MTVSTSYAPLSFSGNGATTAFSVTWPFFDSTLVVTLVDSTGVETVKTITTHYTVSGGTDSDGLPATGSVTMLTAPASGETLRITRNTTKTQSSTWTNGGSYQAKTLEASLDRAMLIAQENAAAASDALDGITGDVMRLDSSGMTDYWDAEDQIIRNVADGTADDDAVNVSQLNAAAMGSYGSVVRAVDTIAALKAFDQTVATRVYLTDANRKGLFVWRSGDYSTEVTNDTQSGIYVKQDDTATTSGAWVREYTGPINVRWFGAAADCITHTDGIITSGTTTFTSASATFTSADVGKVIQIDGAAGVGSAPLSTTIASVTNATTVELTNAATATTGVRTFLLASVATSGSSGSYQPDDILDLSGGTATTTAQARVMSTKVRTIAVNAGGSTSLGDGSYTITGTTGTGTFFTATATVAGGTVTGVSLVTAGHYLTNPTSLAAEPITSDEGTITGCTVVLTMGVDIVAVETHGVYSSVPSNPVSTAAGSVSGATGCTLTVSNWGTTGTYIYGTDDATAFSAAMNFVMDEFAAGGRVAMWVPGGEYLINDTLPVFTDVPGCVIGDGQAATNLVIGADYSGDVFAWSDAWTLSSQPYSLYERYDAHDKQGPTLRGLTMSGFRSATATQNAICFYDHCDGVHVSDIKLLGFKGHGLLLGTRLNETASYVRESYFSNIRIQNCGDSTHASVEITSNNGSSADDATNEIRFYNLNIYGSYGYGLRVRNENYSATRLINFYKLRIEGHQYSSTQVAADLLVIGNPSAGSLVHTCSFYGCSLQNAPKGYAACRVTAFDTTNAAYQLNFTDLNIGGGAPLGKGLVLEYGRLGLYEITGLVTYDTELTVSSTVGSNTIAGGGASSTWDTSIHATAAPNIRFLPSVGSDIAPSDNVLARFDGTTGLKIQESGVTLNDSDYLGWNSDEYQVGYVSNVMEVKRSGVPTVDVYRTDANGGGGAGVATLRFVGIDDGSNKTAFAQITSYAADDTDTSEDGQLSFFVQVAGTLTAALNIFTTNVVSAIGLRSSHPTYGLGYNTGAGSTVTQTSSRTTAVSINAACGSITLVSAAGSTTPATFTVSNTAVAATDTIIVNQKSGTDLYNIHVTAVGTNSFNITFWTTGGTTTEQPVFNFAVIKAVTS